MIISKNYADKIINEINDIIDGKINIMNKDGVIISSTDKNRIGTIHLGALKIINENLDELIIYKDDYFKGTKKGVNYPIFFKDSIIGVVGISGDYEKISNFAKLVKKITEINISELEKNREKLKYDAQIKQFYIDWVKSNMTNFDIIEKKSSLYNIDVSIKRRFVVYDFFKDNSLYFNEKISHYLFNYLSTIFVGPLFFPYNDLNILALPYVTDETIKVCLTNIQELIFDKYNISIRFGVDNNIVNIMEIKQNITKAKKAYQKTNFNNTNIIFYNDLKFEIIRDDILDSSSSDYINNLFKYQDIKIIKQSMDLLFIYYKFDGSINKAADFLFMHKNTLQYKLNRIYEITGYNPRSIKDSFLFQLALNLFLDDSNL